MGASLAGARWEHFDHDADIGVRGIGPKLEDAFAGVGLAMTAVVTELDRVRSAESVEVECQAENAEELLLEWIHAIVFEMATRDMLFGRFEVEIEDGRLRARLFGEKLDRARHQPAVEIKGPTYTELRVVHDQVRGEWTAQCVVDV